MRLAQVKKIASIHECLLLLDHLRLGIISTLTAHTAVLEPVIEGQLQNQRFLQMTPKISGYFENFKMLYSDPALHCF